MCVLESTMVSYAKGCGCCVLLHQKNTRRIGCSRRRIPRYAHPTDGILQIFVHQHDDGSLERPNQMRRVPPARRQLLLLDAMSSCCHRLNYIVVITRYMFQPHLDPSSTSTSPSLMRCTSNEHWGIESQVRWQIVSTKISTNCLVY